MVTDGEWFRHAFDELYLVVYRHRTEAEAEGLLSWLGPALAIEGQCVLDLACGAGRFAAPLLRHGARAYLGVDLSRPLLTHAQTIPPAPGAGARVFVRADMRRVPLRSGTAGIVLSMFSSLGYFADDAENRSALEEIARVLAPKGRVAIDLMNPTVVRGELRPEGRREAGDYVIEERRAIRGDRIVKHVSITRTGGAPVRNYVESVRLLPLELLTSWCASLGLERTGTWGDYSGGEFDSVRSPRMLARFEKRGL